MRLTSSDLHELGLVDTIIPEPPGGAHIDHRAAAAVISEQLWQDLQELNKLGGDELIEDRFLKFRAMGKFIDEALADISPSA